jgi:hypothetical protein
MALNEAQLTVSADTLELEQKRLARQSLSALLIEEEPDGGDSRMVYR